MVVSALAEAHSERDQRSGSCLRDTTRTKLMLRAPGGSIPVTGIFKNFNTIEEFKATDPKKELFNQLTDSVS
jgi:hypothetical protein